MKTTSVTINRPNILGSEVGLVLKPITIPASQTLGVVEENGVKYCVKGTIIKTPMLGILYDDVEVGKPASLMIRGSYLNANLPVEATAEEITAFAEQGLYNYTEGGIK